MGSKILFGVLGFAILFTSIIGVSAVYAEELTVKVGNIVGTVEVIKAGETQAIPAEDGMMLNVGDTIKTGDKSSVTLTFMPQNTIEVGINSKILISRHFLDSASGAFSTKVDKISGSLRAILENLPPQSIFEVKTPTVVAAVRGTIYYVGPNNEIYVQEGSVTVTNLITGEEFVIPEGQFAVVSSDGIVDGPREPTPEEMEDVNNDFIPLEAEPYEPPEAPGIVITPNTADPTTEAASEF